MRTDKLRHILAQTLTTVTKRREQHPDLGSLAEDADERIDTKLEAAPDTTSGEGQAGTMRS